MTKPEAIHGLSLPLNHLLNDLEDIEITSVSDKEVLTYDSGSSKWKNEKIPRELYFNPVMGTELYDLDDHSGYRINVNGETAYFELCIPSIFSSLLEAKLIIIALETVTNMRFNLTTDFGKDTELRTNHSDSDTVYKTVTVGHIYEIDISGALTGIEAGDYVGLKVVRLTGDNLNVLILGVRLKYT